MNKSSIYGLTLEQLRSWLPEHGQKNPVHPGSGNGYIKSVYTISRRCPMSVKNVWMYFPSISQ